MRAALLGLLALCQWRLLVLASEDDTHVEDETLHDDEHDDEDEDEHEHEHEPWEWSAIFELESGEVYTWSAARGSDGSYADEDMKLAIVALGADDHLEDVEPAAEALFEGPEEAWANATSGGMLELGNGVTVAGFRLQFDEASWLSLFQLEVAGSGRYAFFAQHLPSEFESDFHFFKDEHGHDIEPLEDEDAHADDDTGAHDDSVSDSDTGGTLGLAVGAACIMSLPALVMIALVGPAVQRIDPRAFPVMNSFASGAVFSSAAFLLMPEGLYMAGAGMTEAAGTAIWGSSLLGGWLLGVLIHHIADIATSIRRGVSTGSDVEQAEEASGEERKGGNKAISDSAPLQASNISIAAAVLFGDFFHNLVDGMVIGFSARACTSNALWGVTVATALHEAPQEIADFIVLLTKAKMNWRVATVLNFLTAFPAGVFGAIIAHEADMSENLQGIFMGFSAGVYLFVAVTELGPSVLHISKPPILSSVLRCSAFVLGAILIGLVLLGHEHCGAEVSIVDGVEVGELDDHSDHAH